MRPATRISLRIRPWSAGSQPAISLVRLFVWLALLCATMSGTPANAQLAGQNVNMVSGTGWTNGDPFLERQNEPSIAVSTRNSSHLFGAANDYRTVDLPGLLGIDERGDAWLGIYKSVDGGLTWRSTLLPGYPLDSSPEGAASPIHGRQAAADPLVRAGSNGLFYLTGIAFDRGASPLSKVFISRFIDLNNKENGDAANENGTLTNLAPRDTVKYVDTHIIDSGSPNRFLDKPWVAVDIPRGSATCTVKANEDGNIVTQKIPAGAIYVTYTAFTTINNVQNSQILFRRSTDCGVTWSRPIVLSTSDDFFGQSDAEGQGTVIAIDPSVPANFPARIYVAWRVFAQPGDPDDSGEIRIAKSTNGGLSFDEQETAVRFPLLCNTKPSATGCPFDQGTSGTTFRSNGYPSLTVDNVGRIYLAWSQRDSNGDGRIMMAVSNRIESWPTSNFKEIDFGAVPDDYGNPFSNLSNRGSQLMPTLNFNAGKLILTYYDLRQDHTSGMLTPAPEPTCDPAVTPLCPLGNPFSEMRQFESELLTNPGAVFNAYIDDATLTVRRHTLDILGSEGSPDPNPFSLNLPSFTHFRVSRYEYGIIPPGTDVQQAQYNVPNLPMFVQGTAPFMGDYIDIAGAPSMVPTGGNGWKFNTSPSSNPVFHAAWTDNRDVIPPPDGISWNKYTPPFSASIGATSKFDPTQTPPACISGFSGMRNQNIYTSTISHGLVLTSPQTAKPVLQSNGQPIPREFALILRNDTSQSRTFQLSIPAQPASAQASFLQFGLQTTLIVNIPALSSASRPVFLTPNAGSTVSFPSFQVNALETDGAQPPLTASILFNADPTNPFLANPDNASFGSTSINSLEFYNPSILNPPVLNPAAPNPSILNPSILNPSILNPSILNPSILNPSILNPDFVVALNPSILNPSILNPSILNNAVANPSILNPSILNTPVTDASYTVTNQGNTSSTYHVQLFQSGALPLNSIFQIILTKTYLTPGISPTDGCTYGGQVNNEVVASIDNPSFVTDPTQLGNPSILNPAINNPTFALAPGDTLQVTLRANLTVSDMATFVIPNLTPVVASNAVNTVDVQNGITTPPISLLVSTTTLPFAVTGQPYSATLTALGGNAPLSADTWSLIGGSLPPGLNLSAAGVIFGAATATGAFSFVVQVTDTGTPQHTATHSLTINVFAPVAIQTPPLPNAALGSTYTQGFTAIGGLAPYSWSSTPTLPPGLTLSSNGTLTGVPTALGTLSFTVTATDSLGLCASAPYSILVTNVIIQQPGLVSFVVQPSGTVGSQPISPAAQVQVADATGAPIANAQVAMSIGNAACPSATLSGSLTAATNATGIATFSNLLIDHGQNGYTLRAIAGNVFTVSNAFNVEGFCETGSMATARHNHIVLSLPNGKVLITGGAVNPNGSGALASAELYDPASHSFTTLPNMSAARVDHTMTLLPNGEVLIGGGFNDTGVLSSAELFDPSTNTFTLLATTMSTARAEHTATLLANGKVLIAGGNTNVTTLASAEIFDPTTSTFTLSAHAMNTVRQIHHADLLSNGRVLISGGFDVNNNPLASAEIYDPVSDTFTPTGSMVTARGNHASALLFNGKVLVAGGLVPGDGSPVLSPTAEVYDPNAGTFSAAGSMSMPRAQYYPIHLAGGTIFISAGAALPSGNNADIYDPTTGLFRATANFTAAQVGVRDGILPDGTVLLASGVNSNSVAVPNSEVFYPEILPESITITTSSLPNAIQGQPYAQLFQEFGGVGNLAWSLATGSLPPGMTLSTSGVLTGTPTSAGTFTFAVSVRDGANPPKTENTSLLTLVVSGVVLQFTSNTVPSGGAGRFYSQALPIIGGTLPYTVTQTGGTLPPGLSVSSAGMLEGTPASAGSFTFTVKAVDSSAAPQTATQTFTVTVDTLFITTTVLPDGVANVPYNAPISTAGGTLPVFFSVTTAAFPPGLAIQQPAPGSHSGALAGTPTLAGTFTFSESVTDSSNPAQTATQSYTVVIAPGGTAVPANVTFVNQPQTSVGGQTISGGPVIVGVTDASNNPIAGASIALSLGAPFGQPVPCSTAVLSGTLSALTSANGQATFSNLSIDRGGFNYALIASAGSASDTSTPFHVQGFCPGGNLSTQREFHTQIQLGTAQSIVKFPLDPKGTYLFTNTNPAPPGTPDIPNAPLIIPLASLGLAPGSVISGVPVGDLNPCGFAGEPCFGEIFEPFTCGVFSSSNTLSPPGGAINRVLPGAIAPNFNTAIPCVTGPTVFGSLPTDIPQDFAFFGEQVTVPPGAAYLFVAFADTLYADNVDPNGDYGIELTINSPATNGKVLIAGGIDNNGKALNTAELFDPASGTTSPTGNLIDPNGRAEHISVLLPNGKVLLAAGVDNVTANALTSAELYDPATGTFTPTGSMTHPRALAEAVLLSDGRVLVTGGNNTNVGTNTAEIYNPATGLWTPTGNMTQARIRHTMTLLPNGKVLVTGGRDAALDFFGLSSAELFDPFANQGVGAFTPIGNMNSVRFVHTATLLPNGTVLIAGGFNAGNTSLAVASAEIFDPSTNTFTLTGAMTIPRSRYTSTVLPDGAVLAVGGTNSIQGVTAPTPAEIYSASTGSFAQTGPTTIGRELHRASPLFNGNVLVSGGDDGVNVLSTTEVYYNPVVKEPIQITTTTIPNAVVGQPYVAMALEENSAGPVTWSIISGAFPPGIKGSTIGTYGVASGTPTTAGSFTFTAQVTDGISTATQSFTINVSVATLAFTSNTMPRGGLGKTYNRPLPVTGGTPPYTATLTNGSLPPGLSLSSGGILSGTPSLAGTFTFTVNVTDSSTPTQSATQTLSVAVLSLSITTTALPGGMVGVPYNAAITTDGGTLPLTFSQATVAFPQGLSIQQPAANSVSGALTGMPTLPGHYTFTETVTDSSTHPQTALQNYTMDILPAGATTVPALLTFLTQPQNSVGGQVLSGSPIRVRVTDANNALVAGASVAMSFNGAPSCSTAVLSGTLTAVSNGNGLAVFTDLSIDRGQLGYTLLASAGSASAVSQPFTVNGFCSVATPVFVGSFAATTLLANGKALITGGIDVSGNVSAAAQLYDPTTQTFTPTGSMQLARREQTSTLLADGRVLITGGRGGTAFNSPATSTAEIYDPVAGTFTATASPMNFPRRLHTATTLADGTVLVVGGVGTSSENTAEIFDPKTGAFTLLTATLATARDTHAATLLPDGTVLLAGGESAVAPSLNTTEIYNPSTRTFAAAPAPMNSPRSIFNSVLLPTGKVLLVGGISDSTGAIATATAELYDPAGGTFTPTGSMSSARAYFTANLLPNGQVLVEGGLPAFTAASNLATAEVYDPVVGTFSQTGSLSSPRAQQTSVTLNDGAVLVTQGAGGSSDEIYYSTAPLAPLAITTTSLATGLQGQPYTQILLEQGGVGNLTWTVAGALPTGMTFSPQGILGGTPTVSGTFPLTFTVTDSSTPVKTFSLGLTLQVAGQFVFSTTTLPNAVTHNAVQPAVPYSTQLLTSGGAGGAVSFSVVSGALPPSIALNAATGALSSASVTDLAGNYNFTIQAVSAGPPSSTATQAFTLTLVPFFAGTTPNTLPGGTTTVAYSQNLTSIGGTAPFTYQLASGITGNTLPPGLGISSPANSTVGQLSGTPTQAGTFTFTIQATDSSTPQQSYLETLTITITLGVAPAAHVSFTVSPQNSIAGQTLQPSAVQVLVTDTANAPIPNASVTVGFNGAAPCAAAVLGGTITQTTDATGTATFADLTINRGQFGYALAATAGGITGISSPFNVEGFCDTGSLALPRVLHSSVALPNGMVLIAGGARTATAFNTVSSAELYNPASHSFTNIGSMKIPRQAFTMTLLQNGLVLIAGGFNGTTPVSSAELFDPSTNTFTLLSGSMVAARAQHVATLLSSGKVLITGGDSSTAVLATAEVFDPATNTFAATSGPMNAARSLHHADLLSNGKVLVTGGSSNANNILASAELYDPVANTFTSTGSMATPRFDHASALLFTGKLLVAGGNTPGGSGPVNTAAAELYDPSLGTFSPTGSAAQTESGFYGGVPILADGTVLLASGGPFAAIAAPNQADIYDPSQGAFRFTGNMTTQQELAQTALLPDGTVLLAGGENTDFTGVANAEIFYPSFTSGITITLTLLPSAQQNQPYTQLLLEKGGVGALTWALTPTSGPLPTGLILSPSGILSGTPTAFGAFAFTVQVTDSSVPAQTSTITYALLVNPFFQFLGTQLPTAFSGVAYTGSLPIVGGTAPYASTLTGGVLPAGLTLANNTITGTTTALGAYPLTFQATDSSVPPQSTTGTLTLGVTTPLTITTTTLPNGALNSSYSATIATSGGLGTIIIAPTASALPPGLTMDLHGVISGTPTQTGTFNFSVVAIDQSLPPQTFTQAESITVTTAVAPIALSPNPLNLLANSSGNMTVTLSSPAGPNGQTVGLASSDSGIASVPASVTVLSGTSSVSFQVTAGPTAGSATITASAPGATSGTATVVVTTRPMSLTTDGPLLAINRSFNATVTLAQPAPSGGVTVSLAANPLGIVSIAPTSQTIPSGQSTAQFTLTAGTTTGGVILTASASGYTNATAPLTVTGALVSLANGLIVAPAQTSGLAFSLSSPAPASGLTVNFVSNNPAVATVTPSVVVPAGSTVGSSNPQVTGITVGQVNITASAIGFAPDTQAVQVTVTASLASGSLSVNASRTVNLQLNISAAAPQPNGLIFNLSIDNTQFATVPATVTIPAGQVSAQIPVSGIAAGSATLTVSVTGVNTVTAMINVTPAPAINIGAVNLGNNLETVGSIGLGAATPNNGIPETLTLTSSDPTHLLLSTSPTVVGTASISLTLAPNSFSVPTFYLQGLGLPAGPGSAAVTLTASLAGYSNGTGTITVVPTGFEINNGNFTTTTFSSPTALSALIGALNANLTNFVAFGESVGPQAGGPVTLTFSSSNTSVGTITNNGAVTFTVGGSYVAGGASFQPLTAGPAVTISINTPTGYSTAPAADTQITATVTAPAINIGAVNLGNNLETVGSIGLGAATPNNGIPETLTLTSSDPTHLLLSTSPTVVGTGSISLTLAPNSFSVPTFYLQGLGLPAGPGSAAVTLTASLAGYSNGTGTITVVPTGFEINNGNFTTTTFSSPTALSALIGALNANLTNFVAFGESVGPQAGGPVTLTFSSSNTSVGTITNNGAVTFTVGGSYVAGGASFQPLTAGPAVTISINTPTGYSTAPAADTQITATVTAPAINIGAVNLGNNLETVGSIGLGAATPNNGIPETLTLTSSDPTHLLLSTSPTVVGTASISLTLAPNSFSVPTFYLQGLGLPAGPGSAAVTLTASLAGYSNGTGTITVVPTGFEINNGNFTTTTFSSPTALSALIGALNANLTNFVAFGESVGPQAGGPVTLTFSSSNTSVGTITNNGAVTFTVGGSYVAGGASFQPLTAGPAVTISINTPTGYSTAPAADTQITATVTAPAINIGAVNLGNNLETAGSIGLGAATPNNGIPETLTLTSSDPTHLLLSTSPTVVGTASISLTLAPNSFSVPTFYLQGLGLPAGFGNSVSVTLTAKAAGYNDGTGIITVLPTGFEINNGSFNTTTTSNPTPLSALIGVLNADLTNFVAFGQSVGPQAGGPVNLLFSSSNASAGTITNGGVVTFTVGGFYVAGGVSFQPASTVTNPPVTTTISVNTPAGYSTAPAADTQITVTVN